jgi:hypothetical protein
MSVAIEGVSEPARLELRVPLFESALGLLSDESRCVIVDLGRVRAGTIELLAGHRCRLDVLDLAVDGAKEELEPEAFTDRITAALPPARGEQVDLVLCWNLLNYLAPWQIEAVITALAPRCRPGARLHALIEYSARSMPAEPLELAPVGAGVLEAIDAGASQVPAPRYSARDLEQRMPGFAHERTMLLGSGMQEYLFRRAAN